ncbi:MAG: type I-E CRISPR-associated protein Cse1/CasA, partial [Gemmataceae bacterium]|nr:type I-E CRISPR-associated protein Cse1/CasA [Gemmataceae bacterium]
MSGYGESDRRVSQARRLEVQGLHSLASDGERGMVVAWLLGWLLSGGWEAAGSPSAARGLARQEAVARYGTAIWQARQARLLTAVAQLETSLDYQPAALAPRRELARLLEQLERQPAAVRHLQQVLAAQPDDLVA